MEHIILLDVGSTTTKMFYLQKQGNTYCLMGRSHSPTTVERPTEDVMAGVDEAFTQLAKTNGVIRELENQDQITWLATSSAGGGLQVVVVGLVRHLSAESANRAALGAGGIILDGIASNDGRSPMERIDRIRQLHPDLVVFSGGFDAQSVQPLVNMAEIIRRALAMRRSDEDHLCPVIFAGNTGAQALVKETLRDDALVEVVANVRPRPDRENVGPLSAAIESSFMEHVMERAPGYRGLKERTCGNILPTPRAVGQMVTDYARATGLNILLADMGGATTDIFTVTEGHLHRSVSANLGMSYSIRNTLIRTGSERVMRWLDRRAFDKEKVRDYINNKMCHPTHIPQTEAERLVERAVAREVLALALQDHLKDAPTAIKKVGILPSMEDHIRGRMQSTLDVTDTDLLVGSGGYFAHGGDARDLALTLIDGLGPTGVTILAVDPMFITPHLGLLLQVLPPAEVRDLFEQLALRRLCVLIRPDKPRDLKISFIDGRVRQYAPGNIYFEAPYEAERITGISGISVSRPAVLQLPHPEEDAGFNLIVDLREKIEPMSAPVSFSSFDNASPPVNTEVTYRIPLPEDASVSVKEGQEVRPSTVLAMSRDHVSFPWYLSPCPTLRVEPEALPAVMLKSVGDRVEKGEILASARVGATIYEYKAPVRGQITNISSDSGRVVIEEQLDEREADINVAVDLGVSEDQAEQYLRVRIGDRVLEGTILASLHPGGLLGLFAKKATAPLSGTITSIEDGTVIISRQGPRKRLRAETYGKIARISEREIAVTGRGWKINGAYGVGGRVAGTLQIVDEIRNGSDGVISEQHSDAIVVLNRTLTWALLEQAQEMAVKGIVAPRATGRILDEYFEDPSCDAGPGERRLPLSICLLKGFGHLGTLPERTATVFEEHRGGPAVLEGITQIRAGVIRPHVFLPRER